MNEISPIGKRIIEQKFDAVIVMGSPLERTPSGSWHYPAFSPDSGSSFLDGDLKAKAIAQIYKYEMAPIIIVTGGREFDGTSRAASLAAHATENYCVPQSLLLPLTTAPHSLGNLETFRDFLNSNAQLFPNDELAFATNGFHALRTGVFSAETDFFRNLPKPIKMLCAEAMLIHTGVLPVDDVRKYYNLPEIRSRIASEHQGISDFRNGHYIPRS